MEKKKESAEGDIPSHGILAEGTEPPTRPTERTHKSGSRRTRAGRMQKRNWTLPPRNDLTQAELEMVTRLEELTDGSGGIESEDRALTVVMIMTEDRRPVVHDRLLKMMSLSSEKILKKLLGSHQFLLILERWLELYVKSEAWSDVTERLLEVIGKLPLKKGDEHNFKVVIKKYLSQGVRPSIDQSMKAMLHQWDERRKRQEAAGNLPMHETPLSRMHSWPKRKVGKAYVATDPHLKPLALTIKRKSGLSMRHRSSSLSTPAASPRRSGIKSDGLTPEAMDALRKLRMKAALDDSKASMPAVLIHTMESAPSSPTFYIQQRRLYDTLRTEREQSIAPLDEMEVTMTSQTPWKPPPLTQLPPGDIIQATPKMIERVTQDKREETVPSSDSDFLFSSLLESVTSGSHVPVIEFPFFPRNQEQHEQQKRICLDAGVMHPAVLGLERQSAMESPAKGSGLLRSTSVGPMTSLPS